MSIRVYQLANDLNMDSKSVMALLHGRGLKVTSASSSIPNIYADELIKELANCPNRAVSSVPQTEGAPIGKTVANAIRQPFGTADPSPDCVKFEASDETRRAKALGGDLSSEAVKVSPDTANVSVDRGNCETSRDATVSEAIAGEGDGREIVESVSQLPTKDSNGVEQTVPNPGKIIKIPLPKSPAKMPILFVPENQGGRKIAEPDGNLSAQKKSVPGEKSMEASEIPVKNTAVSGSGTDEVSGHVRDVRKKAPMVDFREKRAAPTVRFQFAPKGQRSDQFSNTLKIPNIAGAAPPRDEAEKGKGGKSLICKAPIIVRDFAQKINLKPFQLISELMRRGIFASMNQQISDDVALSVAEKHGFKLEIRQKSNEAKQNIPAVKIEAPRELLPRPPIVCVLGHVDHGKTTLLDTIRHANVVAGEAGGITQHVGAYQVEHECKKITFLDTPGHAAFSNMRERGANLTDIAVLVVAADDGFMPQTDEALKFAQQAGVPAVVAINKIDAKGANVDRVKQQMQQRDIAPEDWGGDTLCVGISALKGTHIDELLSAILLQAEIMELKADYKCPAVGVIIEAQMDVGRGVAAAVIVEKGTLKVGDTLVCDRVYCRVRSMFNEHSEAVKVALPSTSVRIVGWSGIPDAGDIFEAVKDEKTAKKRAEENENNAKLLSAEPAHRIANVRALFEAMESQKQKILKVIIKCDVQGTQEALAGCLNGIKSDKVKIEILSSGVGPVSKNDIEFAHSSEAIVIGFNVKVDNGVAPLIKNRSVRVILHNIIYELVDRVKDEMAELLGYDYSENHLGTAEIRRVFALARVTIAGCMVIDGQIERDKQARVYRGKKVLFEGKIDSLRREKDDHSEVRSGFECGIRIDGFSAFEEGDRIECFEIVQHRQTL
jgi:translation initiation factor IF-2